MRDEQSHFYSPYHCKNFKYLYNYIKFIQNVK